MVEYGCSLVSGTPRKPNFFFYFPEYVVSFHLTVTGLNKIFLGERGLESRSVFSFPSFLNLLAYSIIAPFSTQLYELFF